MPWVAIRAAEACPRQPRTGASPDDRDGRSFRFTLGASLAMPRLSSVVRSGIWAHPRAWNKSVLYGPASGVLGPRSGRAAAVPPAAVYVTLRVHRERSGLLREPLRFSSPGRLLLLLPFGGVRGDRFRSRGPADARAHAVRKRGRAVERLLRRASVCHEEALQQRHAERGAAHGIGEALRRDLAQHAWHRKA